MAARSGSTARWRWISSGTGSRSNGSADPGATGTGGDAHIAAIGGGSVLVAGATALTANGTGGEVTGGAISGGTGRGGTVALAAAGSVTFNGDPVLTADGFGGIGPTGGTAQGGMVTLAATRVPGGTQRAQRRQRHRQRLGDRRGGDRQHARRVARQRRRRQRDQPRQPHSDRGRERHRPRRCPSPASRRCSGQINVTQTAALTTPADVRVIGDGGGTIIGGCSISTRAAT